MGRVFRGGVPYAVDVRRLMDAFPPPSLVEGLSIQHANLEAISNATRQTPRYYSVVNAWMRAVKNTNGIFMVWEPGVGIKVLGPAEILSFAEIRTRQKLRQTAKAIKIYPWVNRDRLNTAGQQRLDHQMRVLSVLEGSMRAAKKEMAINLTPIASLPRPKIEREAG